MVEKSNQKSHCALILPGAVSKGAYEAGVIGVLAEQDIRIDRIVATSSGALNGVAYAAGIRAGREKEMAAHLAKTWIELGGWNDALSFSPKGMLLGKGLSGRSGLIKMMQSLIKPCAHSAKREVELRIIVSPLRGVAGVIGKEIATTYEKVVHFSGADFDTAEGLEHIFEVTTAACAFPGLYAPVEVKDAGPCIDGGMVNNAPLAYALNEGDISRLIVAVPFPNVVPAEAAYHGLGLMSHFASILVNERLYRDLKGAHLVNDQVAALEAMVESGVLSAEQLEAIKRAMHFRKVQITEVRPAKTLEGTVFSGFMNKSQRKKYVAAGREAALMAFPATGSIS